MKSIEQQLWENKLRRFNGDLEAMEKDFAEFTANLYEELTIAQAKRFSALRQVDNLYEGMRKCAEFFYDIYKFFHGYEMRVTESGVWAIFKRDGYAALAFEVRYGGWSYDETVVRTTVLDDSGLSHCICSTEHIEYFNTFDPSVFVERMRLYVPNPREIRRTVFHGIEEMVGRLKETKYGIWKGHAAIQNEIVFYDRLRDLNFRCLFTDEELERMAVWGRKYPWFNLLLLRLLQMRNGVECYRESFDAWAERIEKDLEKSDAELAEYIRDLRNGKEKSQRVMREIMENRKHK